MNKLHNHFFYNPLARHYDFYILNCWTLHQLRHVLNFYAMLCPAPLRRFWCFLRFVLYLSMGNKLRHFHSHLFFSLLLLTLLLQWFPGSSLQDFQVINQPTREISFISACYHVIHNIRLFVYLRLAVQVHVYECALLLHLLENGQEVLQ